MQAPQQMEATLRQMPDQYLMSEMQRPTGRVPQYLVMAEMQRRKQLRQSAQGAQAEGNPPTVADDMMAEAQGIASLPAENMGNIPPEGVVGMADGGPVPGVSGWYSGVQLTEEELLELQRRNARAFDWDEALKAGPTRTFPKPGTQNRNPYVGGPTLRDTADKLFGAGPPGTVVPGISGPGMSGLPEGTITESLLPASDPAPTPEGGSTGIFRGLRASGDFGPVIVPPEVLGATPPPGVPSVTPPGSGSGSAGARVAASGLAGLMPRGGPRGIEIDRSAFQSPEIDALEYMDRVREVRRAAGVKGEPGQETQRYLDESRADIASRRDNRMSNALMNAGLAMMAGESPYFFTNVGRGLQQGVQTYRDIGRELTAEERENQRLAATVEAAQRAERTGMADAALTAENRRKAENLVGAREYAKLDTETQTKLADIASRYDIAQAKINAAIQAAEIRSAAGPAGDPVMARQIVKGLQDAAQMGQEAVNAIISETGGASVDDRNRRIAAVEAGLRTLKNAYGPTALGTGLITPEALDDMFTYIRLTP